MEIFLKHYNKIKPKIEKSINDFNKQLFDENILVDKALKEFKRMNSDGKLLRGFLIYLGFNTFNNEKKEDYVLPLCAIYEAFESAILIHDDIVDNASLRRSKKTIPYTYIEKYKNIPQNKELGNAMALNTGDFAYFTIYKKMIDEYANDPNIVSIVKLFSEIAIKTTKGQFIDIELPFKNKYFKNNNVEKDIFDIYINKTAWYSMIGPFKLGMALAKIYTDEYDHILEYFGIAFQIKDDLLGIYGNDSKTGKSTVSDIIEFKQTILYSYVSDNKKYLNELLKYYGKDNLSNDEILKVQNIFTSSGAKKYAENKLNELLTSAINNLNKSNLPNQTKSILKGLAIYIESREK